MSSQEDVPKKKPASTEPVEGSAGYMYDGEESSPMSKGMRRMMAGEADAAAGDRACNVIAVFLLFAVLITSIISIAAGACCLASLSGKAFHHFPFFFVFGVVPVVLGCVCFVLTLFIIVFISACAMGLPNYGMCCYGTSRRRGALRVCLLGVFPFIVFLVLLAMCILGFTFYSLGQQIPPLDKDYAKIDGLSGPITIVRDQNGLTHVKASSRRDAYVGQGFAEAQDRLFQLEFHRLVGKGELSSTVGNEGVSTDISIRTLNLRAAAQAMCNATNPKDLDHFQAFADGVNLYLKHVSKRPVEFFFMSTKPLFFHDPEPFSAFDLCLTARLFQWQMSSNIDVEGLRFSIWAATNRTYDETAEMFPDFTNQPNTILTQAQMLKLTTPLWNTSDSPVTTDAEIAAAQKLFLKQAQALQGYNVVAERATYDYVMSVLRAQLQAKAKAKAGGSASKSLAATNLGTFYLKADDGTMRSYLRDMADRTVFAYKFVQASNAWAARDASGNAMAASDPHLTINHPSIWYYVHLSFPTDEGVPYDTAGVGLIGLPGAHIARTTYLSWGITMSMTDLQDLFVFPPAMLSGLPENTYMYNGKQRVYVDRLERITVKGKKDIVVHAQDTILGPIVSDMLGMPAMLKVAMFAVPLRHDDNESIGALMSLSDPAVDTAEKLMTAVMKLRAPGFSIPIADVTGNLAYAVTGQHPLRNAGHTGLFPTLALDGPDLLCRIIMTVSGSPVPDAAACDLATVLAAMAASGTTIDPSSINLTLLMPLIQRRLQTSTWSTYVPETAAEAFKSVPEPLIPHVSLPFDGTAANISCANQKITPDGYPYLLGADFAWPYRGARIQELLVANKEKLSTQQLHMAIQLDKRSNIWAVDFRPIVASDAFKAAIADDATATNWARRLLAWDSLATIGSVETSFFWRWLQRMSILPRDVIAATGSQHWTPERRYLTRMLTAPSARMKAECADYMQNWKSTQPCIDFAVAMFKAQAKDAGTGYKEQWGKDLNRMHGLHEMLAKKFVHPVFQREITKAGDVSSVDVSHNSIDGAMESTQAASMRQLYDMWNATHHMYFQLPGGQSGNPYSKLYDNLLHIYEKEEYLHVPCDHTSYGSIDVLHKQMLSQ
ncbi:putative penicillin amidase [Leptomonas pyrrhocoris]|uniref:Putative penicillin amidase n=1 Tax=Leptomonas pyrrhocoris TaxID=157538 RepID=A0A0N0VDS1_LEPPY|nr:putative penicillin amidase [Leptomonas pyrrhocoris]KPA76378.1 putative penicillin amidase [Leptomonas pyrrhocoris]|eukprot:XP_015654817.1 putative penicillin amidase [Leptomonas pyrrhocoris]